MNTDIGVGSGVIFETDPSQNSALLLTNYHVIEGATIVSVVVNDSSTHAGEILGFDRLRDLAVISICCRSDFKALAFGDTSDVRVRDEVVAIGYALGIPGPATVTRGIISALRYEPDTDRWLLQTDAPINPGNSGGPLLSLSGEILGINTFGYETTSSGRPVEGLAFAVSEVTIREALPNLKGSTPIAPPTPIPQPEAPGGIYTNEMYWYAIDIPTRWQVDASSAESVSIWDPLTGATVWVSFEERPCQDLC